MTAAAPYAWLNAEPAPRMLLEAVSLIGTLEGPGTRENPTIVAWADEVARLYPSAYNNWAADWYNKDSIAWCGLAMAVCAARAGREPPKSWLSALAWAAWGEAVPEDQAALGDVLVFTRKGGGHVSLYVGEDATHFHMLGGNQEDAFNIRRKAKSEVYAVRRPAYINRPVNVRPIRLAATGKVSTSEA